MDYSPKNINNNKIRKPIFSVIIFLSLFLVPAFYFQCYYRREKIGDLYCTVLNDFFAQSEKKTAFLMLIIEDAYGINQDVEEQIITWMEQHNIIVRNRAIPPYLGIRSAIATDRKLAEWLKAVIFRRLSVKVDLLVDFSDVDAKEVTYQMRYFKGKWRVERTFKKNIFRFIEKIEGH